MSTKASKGRDGLIHIGIPEDLAKKILKDAGLGEETWYCLDVTIDPIYARTLATPATKPEPGIYIAKYKDGKGAMCVIGKCSSGLTWIATPDDMGSVLLRDEKNLESLDSYYGTSKPLYPPFA